MRGEELVAPSVVLSGENVILKPSHAPIFSNLPVCIEVSAGNAAIMASSSTVDTDSIALEKLETKMCL